MTLVADFVLRHLREGGIERVHGCPCDGIHGLYDAKPDHQSVVALVGRRKRFSPGTQLTEAGRLPGRHA
ncbi:hypothetical protein SHJG_0659 [Streptomyces hygroscopicus subsp. jinggangensis 5008]|nr:hypothetical protein SHJG_0659 [Streptomyces hygroscopicus subsp. jinggangensis 5008]AGF60158.1 hypothetical protein SHJGH_0492 [Streptomyces hygroscopicus subsp. jinggangensis TL01]